MNKVEFILIHYYNDEESISSMILPTSDIGCVVEHKEQKEKKDKFDEIVSSIIWLKNGQKFCVTEDIITVYNRLKGVE